ncbi:helix-turn-helix transcriptional regulator [Bradyrhizobium sp. RT5a]|uniref:helix-turn-helix domain-containing protein n=1 Tax=unclassified Bradyrhizobium TaxID=2631580 RepID=UPI0033952808
MPRACQRDLSQIERGVSSPSVKALHSISRALGVTISWFFPPNRDGESDLRGYVVRASSRRKLTFVHARGSFSVSDPVAFRLVVAETPPLAV